MAAACVWAAATRATLRVVRNSSDTPSLRSSAAMRRDSVDTGIDRRAAACL